MPVRIRGHVEYPKRAEPPPPALPKRPELATSGRLWTAREIEVVRAMYASSGSKFLAERLGRPYRSIQYMAWKLGIAAERRA